MTNLNHATCDTETTGLKPGTRLTELAAQAFGPDGEVLSEFCTLVNPGMPIPADVTELNGITDDMVKDAPTTATALANFVTWLIEHDIRVTVGHNIPYDIGILLWEAARCGVPLPDHLLFVDTLDMAKRIKATKNNKLETLVEHYGLTLCGPSHRALTDADACRQYFHRHRAKAGPAQRWYSDYGYTDDFPPHLAELPQWVETATAFLMRYEDEKGNRTERAVTPAGWALQGGNLIVHGWCHLRSERRSFRADRMLSIITEAA